MSSYERIILKGIPFLMDSSRRIYTYEIWTTEPIVIGTMGDDRNLILNDDWKSSTAARIESWRAEITPTERGKIREQYKPPKQSRSRKNIRKPPTTA